MIYLQKTKYGNFDRILAASCGSYVKKTEKENAYGKVLIPVYKPFRAR